MMIRLSLAAAAVACALGVTTSAAERPNILMICDHHVITNTATS